MSKNQLKLIATRSHLQAAVATVLSAATEVEAPVGVVVDVTMAEKQRSHDGRLVVAMDQVFNDHLEETDCLFRNERFELFFNSPVRRRGKRLPANLSRPNP